MGRSDQGDTVPAGNRSPERDQVHQGSRRQPLALVEENQGRREGMQRNVIQLKSILFISLFLVTNEHV